MIRMIDLFSGIGGFSLAAKMAWGENVETVFFCERDKFCQAVLKKNFGKDIQIVEDIRDASEFKTEKPINLVCGGFPCQPFSMAGKRRGAEDDRYLWPEMLKTIKTFRPTWIIVENVAGIINMALDQVLSSLENQAYTCQTLIIPACAVNAPHRRDRVWIVAHRLCEQNNAERENGLCEWREVGRNIKTAQCDNGPTDNNRPIGQDSTITDTTNTGIENLRERENSVFQDAAHTNNEGLQRHWVNGECSGERIIRQGTWQKPWFEVATRLCGMDDGLSAGVDGLELSKSKHRIERLKALGNAIVPQVAAEIIKAMPA